MKLIRTTTLFAAVLIPPSPVSSMDDVPVSTALAQADVMVQEAARAGDRDGAPTLRAVRTDEAPVIDARLDDAVWQGAPVAAAFTQLKPSPGSAASQRTEVRVLYDDAAVYVLAQMHDTAPDSVVAQLGRRDSDFYSDWFYVALDSYFDRRTAFVFGLNPRGVMQDLMLHNDVEQDPSWDAVWEGAASRDESGWVAEFRIPLSQLRFSAPGAGEEQRWGINFMRVIARHDEESLWAPTLPDEGRVVSVFGELRGLEDLSPPRRLEIMPYALASASAGSEFEDNPLHRDLEPSGEVGADIKAGVTSNLTLTGTVNPDFGQVEADPSVVNLSAFETFFSEKRPFFVEGVDIFRFGLGLGDGDLGGESLFYSRRIGRTPQGRVHGDHVRAPDATRILAAAKLSGKTADGWSLGFLDAVTAAEHGEFIVDGDRTEAPLEPLTNYGVARVMKDYREGRSAVGGILTSTNRSLPESGELDWLTRSAYTGGVDFRHRFSGDTYRLSGSVVASHISGATDAIDQVQTSAVHSFQRPDADHLEYDPERTSLSGYSAKAEFWKLQGDWQFLLFGLTVSPGFEANDLGFQTKADLTMGGYWAGYEVNEPGAVFRRWNVGTNGWRGVSYGGERVSLGGNVNGSFQFTNFWGGNGGIGVSAPEYSTSLLRGGPAFLRPGGWNLRSNFHSDRRKPIYLDLGLNASGQEGTDGRSLSVSPDVTVRPADNIALSLGPSFSRSRNSLQYVATAEVAGEPNWLLGTVDHTTVALTARLNYTFSPTLSLQLYAQPFISGGDYTAFKRVTDPRAGAFTDRVHTLTDQEITSTVTDGTVQYAADLNGDGATDFDFADPSFNVKELRSNLVLRWEYRPGSSVFLVWSQDRADITPDGRIRFRDDVSDLLEASGTNVLMIKASYWFGL